jgi:uncharacterized membrane protein YedE/YeeE
MNAAALKLAGIAAGFVLIFLTGFWLNRSGKPYSPVLFNVHKFIVLGLAAYLVVTVVQMGRAAPLASLQIAVLVIAAVCFVATIVSGGLSNLEQPIATVARHIHQFGPYLTLAASGASLYLLFASVFSS